MHDEACVIVCAPQKHGTDEVYDQSIYYMDTRELP